MEKKNTQDPPQCSQCSCLFASKQISLLRKRAKKSKVSRRFQEQIENNLISFYNGGSNDVDFPLLLVKSFISFYKNSREGSGQCDDSSHDTHSDTSQDTLSDRSSKNRFFPQTNVNVDDYRNFLQCLNLKLTTTNSLTMSDITTGQPSCLTVQPSCLVYAAQKSLAFLRSNMSSDSIWLEFGVYRGKTLSLLGELALNAKKEHSNDANEPSVDPTPPKQPSVASPPNSSLNISVFGFDSFDGLPCFWRNGFPAGKFALSDVEELTKTFPEPVTIVPGLFSTSVKKFSEQMIREKNTCKISLIHIDCDVYESTHDVFTLLSPTLFADKCYIVFDEFCGYCGFEFHECLAFYEFSACRADIRDTFDFTFIGQVQPGGQQVIFRADRKKGM